jgi:hypothetical protein
LAEKVYVLLSALVFPISPRAFLSAYAVSLRARTRETFIVSDIDPVEIA